jgi:hypothetical protein
MLKFVLLLLGVVCLCSATANYAGPHAGTTTLPKAPEDSKCILCGIVVNEIEGMLSENISETDIENMLRKDVCAHIGGGASTYCDDLVAMLPGIINDLNNKSSPGVVCVNRNFCTAPFTELSDPQPVPTYVIDLDLPPLVRWAKICSDKTYAQTMGNLIRALSDFFDNSSLVVELGRTINLLYFPKEYAEEIQGCALAMGVEFGWLTFVNIGYEVSEACTSIVAQTAAGKIYHVRNMDFWDGIWLTDHLKNLTMTVQYNKDGKTLFYATSFAGYVGVLSGMKPKAFSISLNTRYYPKNGLKNFLYEIIAAIMEKNNSLVSFLTRDVLTKENNWNAAVENLSNGALIADVYYIVGGISANEGAVISRNRLNASDVWVLNSTRWFEVQTNYDHWKQPPWFDDRVVPADRAMTALGQANLGLPGLLEVLSVKPVLNLQSTFTMLTSALDETYTSLTRWCPFPCAE